MGRRVNSPWADGLNERERIVVHMLAAGNTCRATAIKAGITERAVYNMRQKKHIQDEIYRLQSDMFDGGGSQGLSLLPEVVATLRGIVNDPESRASDRIQASRVLIASANEYQARRMLERKIRDLERRLFDSTHLDPDVGDSTMGGGPAGPDYEPDPRDELIDVAAELRSTTPEPADDELSLSEAEIQERAAALIAAVREGRRV